MIQWNLFLPGIWYSLSILILAPISLSLLILQEFIFCFPIFGRGEKGYFLFCGWIISLSLVPSNSIQIAEFILLILEKCPQYRNISTIHQSMNIIDYLIILQMRFIGYHVHLWCEYFVSSYYILCSLVWLLSLSILFLSNERQMESGSRWEERQELGRADGGETIIRIYFIKKESIFNKKSSCHFFAYCD